MNDSQASQPQHDLARIEREAIAWFTRLNGEPSASDRRDFQRWRNADASHDAAYRRVTATWAATDELGETIAREESGKLATYLDSIGKARDRRRRLNTAIATGSVLLAFVMGANIWLNHPYMFQNLSADHVTERGERRVIKLADGTSVLLDADSALAENLDATERRVTLLRGTAYFDVVPSDIPFVVAARDGETRVKGTAFSVEITDDVAVTLERGSVEVAANSSAAHAMLKPGQSIHYGNDGLGSVEDVQVDEALAWRNGRLIFNDAKLEEVIANISRYRGGRILLLGGALSAHRVSGNLPLDDPDAALASLQATVGFRMNGAGGLLVIDP